MGGSVRTVSHQYDREGREVETTFPDGLKFWTARDGLGRMKSGYSGATTLIDWTHNKNGSKMEALHGDSFKVFNGSFANFGINVPSGFKVTEIQVNRNGDWAVVMRGSLTGSRIPVTKTERMKKE